MLWSVKSVFFVILNRSKAKWEQRELSERSAITVVKHDTRWVPADSIADYQGPNFDDMSSFFLCEIDDAIQYINLGYGAQAPKIVIL